MIRKSIKENKLWILLNLGIIVLLTVNTLLVGCGTREGVSGRTEGASLPYGGQELIISGSNTLLQVSEAWASAFMEKYGGTIIINGGGSGGGIADLINGVNELANSSRQIKDEELEAAKDAGLDVQEYIVLYDGIAVIVSNNVTVENLTIEQLSKIYTSEITNWKDVGGDDTEIIITARDSSSGTGEYFLEEVVQLGKTMENNDYSETALRLQSNADIVNQIKENDNAIGYIGLGYLEESLKIVKVEGIEPSVDTVKDNSYPISRGLYIYAPGKELTEIGQAYINFVLSDEGQDIGLEEGFVPLK
ncbi:MAG: phosphate ABC transporter substrate-binding protein [Actinobacteria bacterium]|nr:phosphate ABC transporter substrate-binding protein [Actinomycetota bacterium]MBL7124066.1 phosphate ABC transporter substrate-binding protein [Actinomycetota bacterium]